MDVVLMKINKKNIWHLDWSGFTILFQLCERLNIFLWQWRLVLAIGWSYLLRICTREPSVLMLSNSNLIQLYYSSEELSPYHLHNSQSMIICLWLQQKQSFPNAHIVLVVSTTGMKQRHSLLLEAFQDGINIIKGFINFLSYFCSWN
jgi:hypothetical protein